jgi:hypothetical protein
MGGILIIIIKISNCNYLNLGDEIEEEDELGI